MVDDVKARVRDALEAAGVERDELPCDPALADTAAFCEAYGVAPEDSANCIVVAGKGDPAPHVACVVLATTRLDVNGAVRRRLGVRRASFASAEATRALTGMEIGGVTPLGLPAGVPVWVDAAVLAREQVVVGGGSRSLKVRLAPADLVRAAGAEVVEGLATPAA